MTIAIATMGKFLPVLGLRETRTRGGIDTGIVLPPPQPMVFITDIEEKEFDYPFVQVYDIRNGKNEKN